MKAVSHSVQRQHGAITVTVALAMLFLLGFMGIAIGIGHLLVVRDELQSAMDACALAAARELDGTSDAITRATVAGKNAGNSNRVEFQSPSWGGKGQIVDADVSFKDFAYGVTTSASAAKYAQCAHTQTGVMVWLLPALGAFGRSNDPAYAGTRNVAALAVATRVPAQSACPLPIGLRRKNSTPPDYGYVVGEWVVVKGNTGSGPGQAGWFSLDPANPGASSLVNQMRGTTCGIKKEDPLGAEVTGAKNNLEVAWNGRFGIYKNIADADDGVANNRPDYTGYAYRAANWPATVPQNAYSGTPTSDPTGTAESFIVKRSKFASYHDSGTNLKDADKDIYNLSPGVNTGGFKDLAPPGNVSGGHRQYGGSNRRLVLLPVIPETGAGIVKDFACMLMLQPMVQPTDDVQMEYRGNAKAPGSPCSTSGLVGGDGPLTEGLVQ